MRMSEHDQTLRAGPCEIELLKRHLGSSEARWWSGPEPPSVHQRKGGLRIIKRWAVVQCPHRTCGRPALVERDQETAVCRRCGRRFWLSELPIFFSHDDLDVAKRVLCGVLGTIGSRRQLTRAKISEWVERGEWVKFAPVFYSLLPWNLPSRSTGTKREPGERIGGLCVGGGPLTSSCRDAGAESHRPDNETNSERPPVESVSGACKGAGTAALSSHGQSRPDGSRRDRAGRGSQVTS